MPANILPLPPVSVQLDPHRRAGLPLHKTVPSQDSAITRLCLHNIGEDPNDESRIDEEGGRVARIRDYCICPETQAEVTEELGLQLRDWGYRLSDEVLAWERGE